MNQHTHFFILLLLFIFSLTSFNFGDRGYYLSFYKDSHLVNNATSVPLRPKERTLTQYGVYSTARHGSDAAINNTTIMNRTASYNILDTTINSNNSVSVALFPSCPLPQNTPVWNYYGALVHENSNTAERAIRLTNYSSKEMKGEDSDGSTRRIPHLLIFTHKDNLFDCSKSASNSTSPDLYNLAENAKATVDAYSKIWSDIQVRFLTDKDCVDALNKTEPGLIAWFNGKLEGMFKADVCRAAYLTLHGGYYFDVDLLVVRPFVAPPNATFVTVKGDGFPRDGFFQAFLAAEKGNAIVRHSLKIMLDALWEERPKGKYLGPTALMEAWMEVQNITNPLDVDANGAHILLTEVNMFVPESVSKYKKLSNVIANKHGMELMQYVPRGHGDMCQFSGGACNVVVIDELDETLYFYSRVLGTKWCGKRIHKNGDCTTEGILLDRILRSEIFSL